MFTGGTGFLSMAKYFGNGERFRLGFVRIQLQTFVEAEDFLICAGWCLPEDGACLFVPTTACGLLQTVRQKPSNELHPTWQGGFEVA